ncbi:Utp21 specific WD40 associated putative domain-containing protein [Lentinula aff. lateritia]|uniref:Utp21 specific WD40 associated putative domain-containing protein n=1 Tax=Lentinula aff. lateritia TaxID=2804960 RepID=A0ACC1U619_9AGAR|nr:Utp21 specific WD40 associated putative domain-containing protein [Lentinula aff. lateritia]
MTVEELPSPPRKRQRQDQRKSNKPKNEPRLFVPFRALGLITNHIPFVIQTRSHKGATDGPRIHILTCLGKSWALWNGAKMDLLFVGPEVEEQISSMVMDGDAVWIASGPNVIKYIRGKEVSRLVNPLGTTLSFVTIFGTQLLSLTEDGGRMLCWDIREEVLETTVEFGNDFTATSILHPATYLNKVLVSSSQGAVQLWNIRSQTCIHKFAASSLLSSSASEVHAITALTQSSAIDVVGIGFASGEISVYDVRTDERLMRMFMDGGSVRALGFRSDGQPIMASASSLGHIAVWDLNEGGRLLHMVRGAHDGAISALEWIPNQPVLITSGEDNSVKQWLFDTPSAAPRLLKFRSGHHAPPHLVRYYGEDGKQLLTASRDRSLRCTSVVRDSRSFELSQGSLAKKASGLSIPVANLKFPSITAISHSSARTKDWDDILTAHTDETFTRTWTMQNKKLGKHNFGFADTSKAKGKERAPLGSAKSVCVTACGNFGLAGSSTGAIHMWNMQSGIRRRTFRVGPCPPEVAGRFQTTEKGTKERPVIGLATDSLNTVVIASTLDGTVNFFDFHTANLDQTVILPSAAVSMVLQRDNGLLAVVCDDMVVRLVDIETKTVVREFGGFRGRVLDITFSPDSRWLITTSLDSLIRTFDIPTGRLIDVFRTSSVATSVSFSPTNDFIATSHVDSVGVFLWANRAQYAEVAFQTVVEDEIATVDLPSMQGVAEGEESLSPLETLAAQVDVFSTPPKLDGDLITLTLLPRSKWQTLLNLEVIQQRNKPKEPPKAPEKAPFFLPTLPGVETRFVTEPKKSTSQNPSRRLEQATQNAESVFLQRLHGEDINGDYESFFSFSKTLSAAAADLELQSLVTLDSLRTFINALTQRLLSHQDFEAVQAFLNVFLRMHADTIISNSELHDDVERLMKVQRTESQRILELIASSLGALGFVRDTL